MSNGIFSTVLHKLSEAEAEKLSESYVMVSARPGPKISAMLDIASHLSRKAPSALIADKFSEVLARYSLTSASHSDAILEAAELVISSNSRINPTSALGLLQAAKALEVRNPYMRKISF